MDFIHSIPWLIIIASIAKTAFLIFGVVLPLVSYTVYAERRVSALIQDRVGPNRTGFPLTLFGFKKDFSPFLGGLGPAGGRCGEVSPQGGVHAGPRQ